MFNLEKEISKWKKSLRKNPSLEDGYIEELESHLREEINKKINEGLSEQSAFKQAVEKIGQANSIGNEYYKSNIKFTGYNMKAGIRLWTPALLYNYFKIALRNIKRHKGYSILNVAGLAIGMACTILIMIWVQDELSYDRFHANAERIYRVIDYEQFSDGSDFVFSSNPPELARVLLREYPEVEEAVRYSAKNNMVVKYEQNYYSEDGFAFADTSFFKLFTFEFVSGDPLSAFSKPNSIVVTKNTAQKYFGDDNAIGEVLQINNQHEFVVTGVIDNTTQNSHLQFNFIVPYINVKNFGHAVEGWGSFYLKTYVQLHGGVDSKVVSDKIKNIIKDNVETVNAELSLQPVTDIHLYSVSSLNETGDIKYIYIFSTIAVFILLTACINFMNLATARASKRSKEIGLRKVIGAVRKQVITQFYGESLVLSFIALLFSIIIVILSIPYFNDLSGKNLTFNPGENNFIIITLIITTIVTGLVSGSYPAIFLSSFRPVDIVKGSLRKGKAGIFFRRSLVFFQFVLTISLIIGTIVITRQLDLIRNQKLGYDKENVVCINLNNSNNVELLKSELRKNSQVINVSAVSNLPSSLGPSFAPEWEGKQPNQMILVNILNADQDFASTMNIEMNEGRFFSRDFSSDSLDARVINQTTADLLGWQSPVGKTFADGKVIGVIKDYHFGSLHSEVRPLCVFLKNKFNYLLVRVRPGDVSNTIASLEESWSKILPTTPFEYGFLDDNINRLYKEDIRLGKLINTFAVLILFVACLGLFGLASFSAEQRTKEIGIRKVLGASVHEIIFLLSREFTKLVILANIISWPVAYFLANEWLKDFAVKIDVGIWIFLPSGLLAFIVAVLTVGYQAVKTALSNPAKSLRYE